MVVFVDRWVLYRGTLVSLRWPMKPSIVVTIDRWYFFTNGLYDRFAVLWSTVISRIDTENMAAIH